jgi:NADH dehydrogenase
VPGHPDVFVIGDTAVVADENGAILPGVAPVAKQQGQYVARALIARRDGRTVPAFRYRDYGTLATVGRSRAVAQFGRLKVSGFLAWVLWSVAHIYFLIGLRNRFIVALNWAWSYITFERGSRLITGLDAQPGDMRQPSRTELHSKAS